MTGDLVQVFAEFPGGISYHSLMKTMWMVFGWLVLGAIARAEEFRLKDVKTGSLSSPFRMDEGVKFMIGDRHFELIRVNDQKAQAMEKLLRTLRFPEIAFDRAELGDVIEFLVQASKPIGNRYGMPNGVNFDYRRGEFAPDPTVTLSMTDLSFYDAIRLVCQKAGATFSIEGDVVVVTNQLNEQGEAVRAKLANWIIPELAFANATIPDVMDFLIQTSRELDVKSGKGFSMMTNLIYMGDEGQAVASDTFEPPPPRGVPLITLSLRRISMLDALRRVGQLAGVSVVIDSAGIVIVESIKKK